MTSPNTSASRAVQQSLSGKTSTPDCLRLTEMPPAPKDLSPVGRAYWKHYCGIYLKLGNLSVAWLPAIENITRLQDYMHTIQKALDTQGTLIIVVEDGVPRSKLNPLFRDYLRATKQLQDMFGNLGMTPYTARVAQLDMTSKTSAAASTQKPKVFRPADVG